MRDVVRSIAEVLGSSWKAGPRRLATSVVLMLLGSLATPLIAVFLGAATDSALDREAGAAVAYGAAVALAAVLSLTMEHFAHIHFFELADLQHIRVEQEIGDLVHGSAGIEQHERPGFADRVALLRKETGSIAEGVKTVLPAGALLIQITFTAALLALLDPWLLLLPLFALPPVLAGQLAELLAERAELAAAEDDRLGWHLLTLATTAAPAKEVRLFGLQRELVRRQAELCERVDARLRRADAAGLALRLAGQLIFAAGYLGGIALILRAAIAGQRSVGDVVLVLTLAVQINAQAANSVVLVQSLQRNARATALLRWLRLAAPAPVTADQACPAELHSGIELTGVGFRYPGTERDVLTGVTLRLPAGATVAVVGENGTGKSTLVKLLCGFYRPTSGTITVDGVDLQHIDPVRWRERLSCAFQDFIRLDASARESIGVGDLARLNDDGAVRAAVLRADAEPLVKRLPEGLDSHLGRAYEDGEELSGGQWQRIALSRAMMRERPLLCLLDEPSAALDPLTENALFERYAASAEAMGAKTGGITVLVSHRFSTVRTADLIVVLADGGVAEAGDHRELMTRQGIYCELFTLQAGAYLSALDTAPPRSGETRKAPDS